MNYSDNFLVDDLTLDENFVNTRFDPCHNYENSIFTFFIIFLTICAFTFYFCILFRRDIHASAFEYIYSLIIVFALIRFGPKIWGALEVHGLKSVSQTSCKLVTFTEFGLRHVNIFLISCLVILSCLSKSMEKEYLDQKVKNGLPWLIIACFVVEGATGMIPAMYADISMNYGSCDFVMNPGTSYPLFLFCQMLFATILPDLIPYILLIYPLYKLGKGLSEIDDKNLRLSIRNVLIITWSQIFLTLPWALHTVVMLPLLRGWSVSEDSTIVCITDGVFRIVAELWDVVFILVIIIGDPLRSDKFPKCFILPIIQNWYRRLL